MAVKPGFKHSDVGIIPEDWSVTSLGELAEITSSKRIFESDYVSLGIPFYRGKEISLLIEGKSIDQPYFIAEKRFNEIKAQFGAPERGDILITAVGTLANVFVVRGMTPFYFKDGNLIWLRKMQAAESDYVGVQMGARKSDIINGAIGSSQKALTIAVLRNFRIPLPPLPEQRAIATALSDVDALLGALERLIAKKRDLKQAAMQQLLTGQTRLPGFEGEWNLRQLGNIARIQRGASPRPIDNPVWFDENSDIGWVRISDVTKSGMYLRETTQRLSQLGVKHSRPVARGSLIMSICATVGRPIVTEIDVCIHDGFVVFDDLQADKLFIYYMLKWIEPDWSKHGQTGSQMNLNTGLITGTEISLPPLPEQTAIATVLTDMDADLAALEQRLAKTRALKQGMMQELLTGRTRLI